ncbi:MAG: DNA circularization N-terminal domain-containing protein [Nitrospira sp.]|nr:DNA circularization N-terminal domain-containing protein [Nitrospira sp.]
MAGVPFLELTFSKTKRGSADRQKGWRARVGEASYEAPNGKLIKFNYEEVSRKFEARGMVHEFPGMNDAYVQRTGIGPRKYPIRAYFNGPDCDLEATYFEYACTLDGLGKLNHPMYGSGLRVVPYGDIERRDDLVKQANQVIVDVTFWTTTGVPYPFSGVDTKNEIRNAAYYVDIEAIQEFKNRFEAFPENLRGPMNAKTFLDSLKSIERAMTAGFSAIAEKRRAVQDGINLLNRTMDAVVGMPLMLAQQVLGLMKAPGEAFESIVDRIDVYNQIIDSIIGDALAQPAKTLAAAHALAIKPIQIANGFHAANLFVTGAQTGLILSTLDYAYGSKQEALNTAAELDTLFDKVQAWRDAQFAALSSPTEGMRSLAAGIEAGDGFQRMYLARAQTMARLVEISFSLYPERSIITDRPRSVIDLCAELYNDISHAKLDFFINTNRLGGDQLLEIPEGFRIVYYAPRG